MSGAGRSHIKPCSAKEERKLRKPLIERKRRERINTCLEQLKETVIKAFHLDQSKLEKADILEMTVRHLQNIQKCRSTGEPIQDVDAQQRFSTGYIQCMHELHSLLLTCDWMDPALGSRLLNHLLKSLPRPEGRMVELIQDYEGDTGRTLSPSLPAEVELTSVPLHSDVVPGPTQCSLLRSLHMWRPW
ncbi:transcription cofactor HES-6 [Xenopus laevis]|uniref:Transcription cofactor HES-6 n=2 Tax=Xenopus laevis TaxID=8355 RepID=A0A1L8G532_XENLA|nr:transcription cofactor HES-6 [Xenopus laevis]OCT78841.1 hypothetical protein XELAEV_18029931mg [Xenopus laevis]